MTRRDWVSTMAAGLGLSWLPACSTLSQETAGPVAAVAPREARPAPQGMPLAPADVQPAQVQVAADPVRVSPYNPIPRNKVENTGSQGEESSYPPAASSKELIPPPPTMEIAPPLVAAATALATSSVPFANAGISNTPMGPFHTIVFAPAIFWR